MAKFSAYEQGLLDKFDSLGIKTDDPLTQREKIEMARNFELADTDFASNTLEVGGPSLAPYLTPENIDKVRVVGKKLPKWMKDKYGIEVGFNRAGQYVPSYAGAKELEQAFLNNKLEFGGNEYQKMGLVSDRPLDEGSVVLYPPGLGGDTAAHEFMHLRDVKSGKVPNEEAHLDIYAELGYRAETDEEFDEAAINYLYFRSKGRKWTQEELDAALPIARDMLLDLIQERKHKFAPMEGDEGVSGTR